MASSKGLLLLGITGGVLGLIAFANKQSNAPGASPAPSPSPSPTPTPSTAPVVPAANFPSGARLDGGSAPPVLGKNDLWADMLPVKIAADNPGISNHVMPIGSVIHCSCSPAFSSSMPDINSSDPTVLVRLWSFPTGGEAPVFQALREGKATLSGTASDGTLLVHYVTVVPQVPGA